MKLRFFSAFRRQVASSGSLTTGKAISVLIYVLQGLFSRCFIIYLNFTLQ